MKNDDIAALIAHRIGQAQAALDDARYLAAGSRSTQGIINRAYYAMFYAVLALLQRAGTVPSKHSGVISLFDTEFAAKEIFSKVLSRDLHKIFELRQRSDYRAVDSIPPEKAKEVIAQAERFVEAIRKHLSG